MALVVDPWHWLMPDGGIRHEPLGVRKNLLLVMRTVEYGATLPRGHFRDTLLECTRRPRGKRCLGLLVVERLRDDTLQAICPRCGVVVLVVHNWERTRWARGPLPPMPCRDE